MKYIIAMVVLVILTGCGADGSEALPAPSSPALPQATGGAGGGLAPTGTGGTITDACTCVDGAPGTSCSVQQTATGATIACTDGTIASLIHGQRGERGERGETGAVGAVGPASTVPGPRGEPGESIVGPRGEPGSDGADGQDGADGVIDSGRVYVVSETAAGYLSQGYKAVSALCDEGDFAISGGCYHSGGASMARLRWSVPTDETGFELVPAGGAAGPAPSGWKCMYDVSTTVYVSATAVCVSQ